MSISAIGTFHVDRMSDVVVACGLTVFLVLIAKKQQSVGILERVLNEMNDIEFRQKILKDYVFKNNLLSK